MKVSARPTPFALGIGFSLLMIGFTGLVIRNHLDPNFIRAAVLVIGLAAIWYRRLIYWSLVAVMMVCYGVALRVVVSPAPYPWVSILVTTAAVTAMTELIHQVVGGLETTRKRLEENNQRLQSILDTVQSGILIIDGETHRILDSNQVAQELLGVSQANLVGQAREKFVEKPVITDGRIWKGEGILIHPNRELIPIIDSIQPMRNDGSDILVESFQDIRELRLAEQKSREMEFRLTKVARNMLDMVALLDPAGKISYISPSCEMLLGYPQECFIGQSAFRAIHPDDKRAVMTVIRTSLARNEEATVEFRAFRSDGTCVWLEVKGKPFYEENGRFSGSVVSARDITSRKEVEAALYESEERTRLFLSSVDDILLMQDREGRIIYLAASPSYGIIPQDSIGKLTDQIFNPELSKVIMLNHERVLSTGESISDEFEVKLDGLTVCFSTHSSPVRDKAGALIGVVNISRDITAQKAAEARLNESESKYHSLFNNIRDPIFIIDHDSHFLLDANQAALDLYEYSMDELLTMQPHAFYLPEDFDLVQQSLIQEEIDFKHIFTHVTRTGQRLIVEVHRELMEYNGKKVWLSFIHDLTERVKRERITEVIQEIAQAALTVNNLAELYPKVHSSLGKIINAENLFIALYDRVENIISFPYFVDQYDPPPPSCKFGHGLTEYVLRTEKPLLVTPEVFSELVREGEVETIGSDSVDWLGVPLIVSGHTIGVIAVQTYTEEIRYSEEARDILVFVSAQVAMAIERKQSEEKLREAEGHYRQLVEQVNAIMYTNSVEDENRFIYVAPQIEALTGYPADQWLKQRDLWLRSIHPDDYKRVKAENERTNQNGELLSIEYRMITRSGKVIWISDQAVLIRDENGHPKCWQGVMHDITRQKEAEENLRQSEATLAEAQELANLGSYQFDTGFTNMVWSDETYHILGVSRKTNATAELYYHLIHPDEREQVVHELQQRVSNYQPFELEYRLLLGDGTVKHVHTMGRPTEKTNDEPGRYIGMIMDITERKRTEEKLWLLSTHDALTGLFNRAYFESQLEQLWTEQIFPISIVMADVDELKATNDHFGHSAGDDLLRRAGAALRDSFRKQDIVARIGGDEFAILLPGMDQAAARERLLRLNTLLDEQNKSDDCRFPLNISIGVATAQPNEPADQVLKRADEIMYQEKIKKRLGV